MLSKKQISKIKIAAKIASCLIEDARKFLKPGIREKDVADYLKKMMKTYKTQGPSFKIIVASGRRTAIPHGYATKKIIGENDIVMIDLGVKYSGVCSDITRMFFFVNGKLRSVPKDEKTKRIFQIVKKAQLQAISMLKNNVNVKDIDLAVRNIFKKHKIEKFFLHSTGHGIGIRVHEPPRISYKSDEVLKNGMVVTIEPGIYLKNQKKPFGIRVEDMVLVAKNSFEILT